jgi:hypothetical protein
VGNQGATMSLPTFEKVKVEYYRYNLTAWKVLVYPCFPSGEVYKSGGGLYLATFKTRKEAREYKEYVAAGLKYAYKIFD